MSKHVDRRKQRYAEDAAYRERQKAASRAYYHANKQEIAARKQHRLATDPDYRSRVQMVGRERRRGYDLKYYYGLSLQEYKAMSARQKGACAICKVRGKLAVDHCHRTDVVGGLLCQGCNSGIAFFGDSPATILIGATYLIQTRPQALGAAKLARTQRAPRRFIKVFEQAIAARRPAKRAPGDST